VPGFFYLQTYPLPAACPPPLNQGASCSVSITNTPALKVTFEGLAAGMVGWKRSTSWFPRTSSPATGRSSLMSAPARTAAGSPVPAGVSERLQKRFQSLRAVNGGLGCAGESV